LKEELVNRGLPCITYGQIYTTKSYYCYNFITFINQKSANNSEEIQYGDVLFAGSGETLDEIGKSITYLGEEPAYAGGDIIILRNVAAYPHFLSFMLNSKIFFSQCRKMGQGHSVVHIYSSGLKKIKCSLPEKDEQKKIASTLSTLDKEIEKLQDKKQFLEEQKKGLMQQLLTGKTRVKIEET